MEIYTAGFTKRSAEDFFESLKRHRIERLVDIRINNRSQLAGFTKSDDLRYFLDQIVGADYLHQPILAPTPDLLKEYRDKKIGWGEYERRFLDLMAERRIDERLDPSMFTLRTVLLCSEPTPDRCHRRLVVEYLDRHWGDVTSTDI